MALGMVQGWFIVASTLVGTVGMVGMVGTAGIV